VTKPDKKGFALVYLLLLSVVIVMVLGALLTLSKSRIIGARHSVDHTRALNAAESGLSHAIAKLESDEDWSAGFDEEELPEKQGTYSLQFASPTSAGDLDSINNLGNDSAVSSYHGAGTVPPRSALIVVTGRYGTVSRTVEALVVTGASIPESTGIAASNKITLAGDIEVNGIKSLSDPTAIPVQLHSNDQTAGSKVTYAPLQSGDSLRIKGKLTSSSESPTSVAIQLAGTTDVESIESQVGAKRLPRMNIEAMVSVHAGYPGPPLLSGPVTQTFNGNNYYSGDVELQGDLVLEDNARIYVDGDLTINGSVRGTGALVVNGNTFLRGDSSITADESDYVSVLSEGHVVLSGFDGQAFMESMIAGDAEAAEYWDDTTWGLETIQDYLNDNAHLSAPALSDKMRDDDAFLDATMSALAQHYSSPPDHPTGRARHTNTSEYFRDKFSAAAPNTTRAFLHDRFQLVDDMFRVCYYDRSGGAPRLEAMGLVNNFGDWDPSLDGGLFDSAQSWGEIETTAQQQVLREINSMVGRLDYNRLGSAEFKGFVYTSGALVVKSDLNLLGTVVANGNDHVGNIEVDGETFEPGEMALLGNSRLTYVDDIFQDGIQNLAGAGKLDVKRWVNR